MTGVRPGLGVLGQTTWVLTHRRLVQVWAREGMAEEPQGMVKM